jgi:hypothetical protein
MWAGPACTWKASLALMVSSGKVALTAHIPPEHFFKGSEQSQKAVLCIRIRIDLALLDPDLY